VSQDHIPSYPKVYQIGHAELQRLLDGPVVVQEKVDGSQFSFAVLKGNLHMRSKNATIYPEEPPKMFAPVVQEVVKRHAQGHLPEGVIFRGETLYRPRHNTLQYSRIPEGHLVLFDAEVTLAASHNWPVGPMTPQQLEAIAYDLAFEAVPTLYEGVLESPQQVLGYLERESFLGGPHVEGVVIKNYKRYGRDGKFLVGKYVSEQFKETHQKQWKSDHPTRGDILEAIASGLRTEARWRKAVQHAREQGLLQDAPQDIGLLMKLLKEDLTEEERDNVAEALIEWAWADILRKATRGFPEWYKEQLLERAFA
jgi:hypothetical protein